MAQKQMRDGADRVTVFGSAVEPLADVFAILSPAGIERAADQPSLAGAGA